MFNQVQVPRFSSMVRKLLRIVEDQPLPQLAGEITPVITLQGERAECRHLMEEELFSAQATVAGAAGNYGHVMLDNPVGSGALAIVDKMHVQAGAACTVYIGWQPTQSTALWTPGVRGYRDRRAVGRPAVIPYYIQHTALYVAAADRVHRLPFLAATTVDDTSQWVITPGHQLCVVNATQNVALTVTFEGYCRVLAPDEA